MKLTILVSRLVAALLVLRQLATLLWHSHDSVQALSDENVMMMAPSNGGKAVVAEPPNNNSQQSSFPLFHANKGGVMIFYHLPKTGGTTIRENLVKQNITVRRAFRPADLPVMNASIVNILTLHNTNDEMVFWEIHGNVPGLAHEYWQTALPYWRQLATQNNVPLFAFCVLREPLAFYVSYYKHFHALDCKWAWCEHDRYDTTNATLLPAAAVFNHQCHLLWHGQRGNKQRPISTVAVSDYECHQVESILDHDWDWVGTTEHLSVATLPLLTWLLPMRNCSTGRHDFVSYNLQQRQLLQSTKSHLHVQDLPPTTAQSLRNMSRYDERLYRRALQNELRISRQYCPDSIS